MSLKVQTLKTVPEALLSLFTLGLKENRQIAFAEDKLFSSAVLLFKAFCAVSLHHGRLFLLIPAVGTQMVHCQLP